MTMSDVFPIPTNCPSCNSDLEMQGEYLTCTNTDACPAQTTGRVLNWIGALNILDFGDTLIERLVEAGKVKSIVDLYKLQLEDLLEIERMGKKSAQKALDNLWAQPSISLELFLGSLSIPMVGKQTIKILIDNGYDTIDKILSMTEKQAQNVKGLGPAKSRSLIVGLKKNKDIIEGLMSVGLGVEVAKNKKVISGGKLGGKSFVITGKTNIKREDLAKMIENAGGEFQSSISSKTQFLIIANLNERNSTKIQKAEKLGTKVISEDQLMDMMK